MTERRHPLVDEARRRLASGRMERRAFVRTVTWLGVSSAAAYAMAGRILGEDLRDPALAQDGATPRKGGILRVAMQVQKMDDPATYSWVEMSNQTRHTLEYLTITGPDNVTRPMLAESWEPSDDLKTWTFNIRRGVTWHNGDELKADHVRWNLERWCEPALGSANTGLSSIAALLEEVDGEKRLRSGAVEVVDAHTIRLHLDAPVLSVPEDFYNYPMAILHPSFEPPFSANPIGTGPFTLTELAVGGRCILRRVTETTAGEPFEYWGGEVYLDGIDYYNFDEDNQLVAFAGGDVDTIYEFGIEQLEFARSLPGRVMKARSSQTLCCRFKVTQPPFDDVRVRRALVQGVDNTVFRDLVFQGTGDVAWNHHVAPVHHEYFELAPLERDVEGAKALLAEAGYGDGLELTIDVGNTDGPWHQNVCEILRDQWADIGVSLNINVMPASRYWEIWTQTPFGATAWTHRPLGTMTLSLGYRSGVPWNESEYANPEFDAALAAAEATLDVEERRAKMERVEKILQDDAVMVQPLFRPVFTIVNDRARDLEPHPTQYHQFTKVWLAA
ncbi:MAG: ABC transporter substrate-binding protein [Alphaproteobacteria bacterium]